MSPPTYQLSGKPIGTPVWVTGGAGLLGSAIVRQLRASGRQVVAPNRAELELEDGPAVTAFVARHEPKVVYHCAALSQGLGGHIRDGWPALEAAERINLNVFSALARTPPRKVFFAGSVSAYPHRVVNTHFCEADLETGVPHDGELGYALAKLHALGYLRTLWHTRGVEYVYGVLTNLYGPGDRYCAETGHAVAALVRRACGVRSACDGGRATGSLEVWGTGRARRDFLHADDAARAAELLVSTPGSRITNIASGVTVSLRDVATCVAAAAGIPALRYRPEAPEGIVERSFDVTQLRALGFAPRCTLAGGIADMVRECDEQLAAIARIKDSVNVFTAPVFEGHTSGTTLTVR